MSGAGDEPQTVVCVDLDGTEHPIAASELRWRPSAYAIIIRDGKLLVSKQYGAYTIPGGGIELGEMPEQGLIREVKEETGFDIGNPKLVACRSTYFKLTSSTKGAHVQSLLLFYRCDILGGEASTAFMTTEELENGGEAPVWVPLDELDSLNAVGTIDWKVVVRESL